MEGVETEVEIETRLCMDVFYVYMYGMYGVVWEEKGR